MVTDNIFNFVYQFIASKERLHSFVTFFIQVKKRNKTSIYERSSFLDECDNSAL